MPKTTDPSPQALKRLLAEVPHGQEVVMLNLLKFRELAAYAGGQGEAGATGRKAYSIYSREIQPVLARVGGRPIWLGAAKSAFIAPPDETWDEVLLVSYPSVEAFVGMVTAADYQAITFHRTAALEDSRLIVTLPAKTSPLFSPDHEATPSR